MIFIFRVWGIFKIGAALVISYMLAHDPRALPEHITYGFATFTLVSGAFWVWLSALEE